MLYVKGAVPPFKLTVAVPEAWQRLSVVVIPVMDKAVGEGHWAEAA
jgi:hypothetical protein